MKLKWSFESLNMNMKKNWSNFFRLKKNVTFSTLFVIAFDARLSITWPSSPSLPVSILFFFSPSLTREVDGAKFSGWLHPLAIWRAFPRCKGTITRETSNYSKLLTEQRFFLFLFLFFVSNRSRQLARVFRGQVSELSNWGPFDCVYICDHYRLFTPGDHQTFAYVLELQSIGQL